MAVASLGNDVPGPWLQTWIEFQVDARINECLRDMVRSELASGVSVLDMVAAPGDAKAAGGKLQSSSQLLAEVAALSKEQQELRMRLELLTAEMKVRNGGSDSVLRTHTESEAVHREELARRLASVEDKLKLLEGVQTSDAVQTSLADHSKLMAELRIEHNEVCAEQRRMNGELSKLCGGENTCSMPRQIYDEARLKRELQQHFLDAVSNKIQDSQTVLLNDISREVQELRSGLRRELRRDLGVDDHLHELHESVAALDEQLWLTDQRLGQRIDDIAHAQGMHLSRRQIGLSPSSAGATHVLPTEIPHSLHKADGDVVGGLSIPSVIQAAMPEVPEMPEHARVTAQSPSPQHRSHEIIQQRTNEVTAHSPSPQHKNNALSMAAAAATTMMENSMTTSHQSSVDVHPAGQPRDVHLTINVRRHQDSHGGSDRGSRERKPGLSGRASPFKQTYSPVTAS
eukprot:gnl/MRDRNA2_/MRDRNA2_35115_c0_seq1.p1 gnl/MRDRNA2_/MRDRNA2_35115_c0~~gnl/MRDRNA2_/MRDRNA2_35115_c0_seq1.p1  ORF type:complete len:457 (-),score=105.18 gnl/MRDRNA2_/MRDRNA2_35115_c0_seq1:86-1456(-)